MDWDIALMLFYAVVIGGAAGLLAGGIIFHIMRIVARRRDRCRRKRLIKEWYKTDENITRLIYKDLD